MFENFSSSRLQYNVFLKLAVMIYVNSGPKLHNTLQFIFKVHQITTSFQGKIKTFFWRRQGQNTTQSSPNPAILREKFDFSPSHMHRTPRPNQAFWILPESERFRSVRIAAHSVGTSLLQSRRGFYELQQHVLI